MFDHDFKSIKIVPIRWFVNFPLIDLFVFFFIEKIAKRWGNTLEGQILKVDLDRPMLELGGMVVSLGLSLAGHKDRSIMSSYICGLNPTGKYLYLLLPSSMMLSISIFNFNFNFNFNFFFFI